MQNQCKNVEPRVQNMAMRMIGRLLRGRHAGDTHLAWNHPAAAKAPATVTLSCNTFSDGETMPRRHAGPGVGDNISPALSWSAAPEGSVEWVLIMEDPHAPLPRPFVHLVAYGIPAEALSLADGALNHKDGNTIRFGRNTFSGSGYSGPRALPGHGPHGYVFQVFAVSKRMDFERTPTLHALIAALHESVIAKGRLVGVFEQV
jgi:Raf kinase inhibitor-like YbhB/YbcL family protein